ncbi:beta-ketoacyl synthase chain length factor [Frateuria defendens]|uniref:beta-ketoacyl synthase chain length factor n=1 Tax=Frateuria defendens TaxID=2219559 RepID=UPI00066FDD79|nr:beta-ketoacyl synthase chain length factor [Frateuria defendens]
MTDFLIEHHRAWAPGLDNDHAWQTWAQAPYTPDEQDQQPSCAFLPAMQRRRLSRLARMVLDAAWPLCGEDEQLPLVFASRHGETTRTVALLGDIADEQPLSPTQFGLSVHNAIAGQWSILRGQRGESVAVAGETDGFEHAMLEGALLLAEGAPSVLVVVAEEKPAPAYADWIEDVPFSYAAAFRLGGAGSCRDTRGDAPRWRLQLTRRAGADASSAWPHALDFLRALHDGRDSLEHSWKNRRWNWQRLR